VAPGRRRAAREGRGVARPASGRGVGRGAGRTLDRPPARVYPHSGCSRRASPVTGPRRPRPSRGRPGRPAPTTGRFPTRPVPAADPPAAFPQVRPRAPVRPAGRPSRTDRRSAAGLHPVPFPSRPSWHRRGGRTPSPCSHGPSGPLRARIRDARTSRPAARPEPRDRGGLPWPRPPRSPSRSIRGASRTSGGGPPAARVPRRSPRASRRARVPGPTADRSIDRSIGGASASRGTGRPRRRRGAPAPGRAAGREGLGADRSRSDRPG
jgi:hypothetical protein